MGIGSSACYPKLYVSTFLSIALTRSPVRLVTSCLCVCVSVQGCVWGCVCGQVCRYSSTIGPGLTSKYHMYICCGIASFPGSSPAYCCTLDTPHAHAHTQKFLGGGGGGGGGERVHGYRSMGQGALARVWEHSPPPPPPQGH